MPDISFAPLNRLNISLLTTAERRTVYGLMANYGVRHSQVSPSQRLLVSGLSSAGVAALEEVLEAVGPPPAPHGVTWIHSCSGVAGCGPGAVKARALARRIYQQDFGAPFPHKVKVAIAGCAKCCTLPYLRDVGLLARCGGWTVLFGGNGGGRPRIAEELARNLTEDEAALLVARLLGFYLEHAGRKQRTARFVESYGVNELRRKILRFR